MKIKGTCKNCGREFLVEQVVSSGGRCPWCGHAFQTDYAAVLVEALRDAEAGGNLLESALQKAADLDPDLVLDADSVLLALRDHIQRLRSGRVRAVS